MNQVSLIGRITNDLELRDSANGTKFVGFTVAVSEFRKDGEHTQFIPCIAWDNNAIQMTNYLKKGSLVGVTGRISVRSKQDNGKYESIVNINADRVEFLESKSSRNNETQAYKPSNQQSQNQKIEEPQNDNQTIEDSILWD
ncbi:single-strand DNA-binding protein [Williamsoniiplasma luminosum]|uniref:Single-stranded DNA-binding protein n=1 Tax=Williamsoniiplasma luminosum TaxID=214888 RepID=A0A2K8NSW9_9MOLU|nr:single-stranded DNA-binding protein [Williamsoniiplasma luminosum]ATZ16867.1 single-strand DNA-binding protein [Williamsoniiplasma luminosum]AVP49538.1 MAG: single-stranded DNA-binding protein [Williamsoniiplasma luminosum]